MFLYTISKYVNEYLSKRWRIAPCTRFSDTFLDAWRIKVLLKRFILTIFLFLYIYFVVSQLCLSLVDYNIRILIEHFEWFITSYFNCGWFHVLNCLPVWGSLILTERTSHFYYGWIFFSNIYMYICILLVTSVCISVYC